MLAHEIVARALLGGIDAYSRRMVRDFRELVCWQLAWELKNEVLAFTSAGPAATDFKYRDQIRDSSASAPRNIAEGFGRFAPGDFARFLNYARASLIETQNHLLDGHERQYLDAVLYRRLSNLTNAATRLTTKLMRSKQQQAAATKRASRQARPTRSLKP